MQKNVIGTPEFRFIPGTCYGLSIHQYCHRQYHLSIVYLDDRCDADKLPKLRSANCMTINDQTLTSLFRPTEKFGTHSTILGIVDFSRQIVNTKKIANPKDKI